MQVATISLLASDDITHRTPALPNEQLQFDLKSHQIDGLEINPARDENERSNFVVVIGSKWFKSILNESIPHHCK
jgi:hypothetical protein